MPDLVEELFDEAKRETPAPASEAFDPTRPNVRVTLASDGTLRVVLGDGATTWTVPLYDVESLREILEGQLAGRLAIGLSGGPTAAKALHDAKHREHSDPRCPFCSERSSQRGQRLCEALETTLPTARPAFRAVGDGSVSVRRVPIGETAASPRTKSRPASRFDCPPSGVSRAEPRQWRREKARWEAEQEERELRKQGRSRTLTAKELGL